MAGEGKAIRILQMLVSKQATGRGDQLNESPVRATELLHRVVWTAQIFVLIFFAIIVFINFGNLETLFLV